MKTRELTTQPTNEAPAMPAPQSGAADIVRDLLATRAMALGLSPAVATSDVHDEAIERLLEEEVRVPEATEEECSRYYAVHEEEFTAGELIAARHILFAVTPGAPAASIRSKAEQVLHDVLSQPERFADLARENSNCPSGALGGDLGQLSRGQCAPEFEQALFDGSKTIGVLPRLVNTRFGFHVVCIDRRLPGQLVPYEHVRARIAAHLAARVQETALSQYVRMLAGAAGVEIPGVASATSPLVQ